MLRLAVVCIAIMTAQVVMADMPLPFTEELVMGSSGNQVLIAQHLLSRVPGASVTVNSVYDEQTAAAVELLQSNFNLPVSGNLDSQSANVLLGNYHADGIRDDGFTARSLGYLYKFVLTFYHNRSIETTGTLYDADNNFIMNFTTRGHGHRDNDQGTLPWPDFGDGDIGLNQFSSNGATTTGIIEVDLNSPEDDPKEFGPYPINRFVRGLKGNAAFLQPGIRDGILLHTGNWSLPGRPWNPSLPMPNSSGCIHAHPDDILMIYKRLVSLGVVVNPNPFAASSSSSFSERQQGNHENSFKNQDYPYKPQGIAVIQEL